MSRVGFRRMFVSIVLVLASFGTVTAENADTERGRLEFEREKWRAEVELRARELMLKEREVAVKERELALKRADEESSTWKSPWFLALLAAVVSAVASAIGLVVNGRQKRRLEENKAESSRILEMIKTPDTEAAAQNLEFLIDSGLVASPEQVKRLREYLKERKFGTGPSLPANSDFDFEPSEGLTLVLQEDLERNLTRYIEYLDKIGLSRREEKAKIKIDELDPANAHYNSETR